MVAADARTSSLYFPKGTAILFALILAAIIFGAHSVSKHAEAQAIHRCLEQRGPDEVYRFANSQRRANQELWCVETELGWGLALVQRIKRGLFRERTSFIPDGTEVHARGSYGRLLDYIKAKDVIKIGP